MDEAVAKAGGEPAADGARRAARPDPVVVREFPALGKYRVRLVKSSAGPRASTVLDVREFAKSETFEGFTRRGIRISTLAEARALRDVLRAIEEEALLK